MTDLNLIRRQIGLGTLMRWGARNFAGSTARPTRQSQTLHEGQSVDYEAGLVFNVTLRRGATHKVIVAYEPNDTYTVYLWEGFNTAKMLKTGKSGRTLAEHRMIGDDNLAMVIDRTCQKYAAD